MTQKNSFHGEGVCQGTLGHVIAVDLHGQSLRVAKPTGTGELYYCS
jgi:hypothetical protein